MLETDKLDKSQGKLKEKRTKRTLFNLNESEFVKSSTTTTITTQKHVNI
jgi:hypothetical protein